MPLVSVVTPTHAPNARWLGDAWASLCGQRLPAGWELEWLVQEDGERPSLREELPLADPRVRFDALGLQLGGPTTRNAALARARGDLIAGLDHDDFFTTEEAPPGGGLAAMVAALAGDRDAAWACGRSRLLLPDGGSWTKPDVLAPGRVGAGVIARHFVATDDFPFPAAFATYRRDVLVAEGGWPAAVRSADAVLLAAISSRWPGAWLPLTVAVYRRHPAQTSVRSADLAIRDLPHVRGVIAQRLEAEERLGRLPEIPPRGPSAPGGGPQPPDQIRHDGGSVPPLDHIRHRGGSGPGAL